MDNVKIIGEKEDIVKEVLLHLKGDFSFLKDYIIVFPGKRPSQFLAKNLASSIKGPYEPPQMFSMDSFVDHVYENWYAMYSKKLESLDAVGVLFELQKKTNNPLGGKKFLALESFFQIALQVFSDIETLYIENVEVDQLRTVEVKILQTIETATVDTSPLSMSTLNALAFFYEKFYDELDIRRFSTKSSRYRYISKHIDKVDISNIKKIIFAGFYEISRSEVEIFKYFLKQDNSLFLFQKGTGLDNTLKRLGIDFNVETSKETTLFKGDMPDISFYKSPDSHGQVFAVSKLVKDIGVNNISEDSVVVLLAPDTLFPLYNQTLSLFEKDSFNISIGYPLQRTPIYGFFTSLIDLLASMEVDSMQQHRYFSSDYLKFVLHPYIKNILFGNRADITRAMFHAIEESLTKNRTRSFIYLEDLYTDNEIFNEFLQVFPEITKDDISIHLKTIHENTILKFQKFENIEDFAIKAMEILYYINDKSTANYHYFFYPFSERFLLSFFALKTSVLAKEKFNTVQGYFNLFKKYIRTCRMPFEGVPVSGLQVLGFFETRNVSFKRVFILDVNEDIFPGTKKIDTFLPFKARKALGVPTYLDSEKRINYYFDMLINGADEVHVFYIESDKKEKSRLVEKLLWKMQKRDCSISQDKYIQSIQYNVEIKNAAPKPIEKSREVMDILRKQISYSSSSIDTYLFCPLKFYYRYVLLLVKRKEIISGEMDKSDVGTLVHSIISRFFINKKDYRLKAEDLSTKEMEKVVNSIFESIIDKELLGLDYLMKKQIKKRMIELVEKYFIPLVMENSLHIVDIEKQIQVFYKSLKLYGRIDKIFKINGKYLIVDYKTAARKEYLAINFKRLDIDDRGSWKKNIPTLQLPFYTLLFSQHEGISPEETDSMFLLLGRHGFIKDKIEVPLFDDKTDKQSTYIILEKVIQRLLKEIIDEKIPFNPAEDLKDSCPLCDYRYICGT